MKTNTQRKWMITVVWLLFLPVALASGQAKAQGEADQNTGAEGIVVYSDTSGTASADSYPQDAEENGTDPAGYADSTWYSTSQTGASFFMDDDDLTHPFRFIGNLFQHLFGIGMFLAIVLGILMIVFPLLLIAALIYLIVRLTRSTPYRPRPGDPPLTPDEVRLRQRQQTIRLASIGVALLLVEWFFGLAHIAGITGIVLLCIAGGQWLSIRR